MKAHSEIERLADRYKKYGITTPDILRFIESGKRHGISQKAALVGVRMALSEAFGEREWFSEQDIAEAIGSTVDEVRAITEAHKAELMQHGELVSIDPLFMELLEGGKAL